MKVTQFAKPVYVKSTTRVEKTITVKVNKFAEPVNEKSWVSRCPIGSTAPRVNTEQVREGQCAVHEVRAGVSCQEDRHREGDPVRGTSGREVHTQSREDHHREGGLSCEDPDVDGRRGPLLEHPH